MQHPNVTPVQRTQLHRPAVGDYVRESDEGTRGVVRAIDRGVYHVELEGCADALFRYSAHELHEDIGQRVAGTTRTV